MAVIPVSPSKFNKYLQILYVLRIKKKLEVKSPILILTISRRQEVWKNALCQNLTRVVSVCCQCQPTKTHFILISGACWNHQNRRSIYLNENRTWQKNMCVISKGNVDKTQGLTVLILKTWHVQWNIYIFFKYRIIQIISFILIIIMIIIVTSVYSIWGISMNIYFKIMHMKYCYKVPGIDSI